MEHKARTLHDVYVQDYLPNGHGLSWREWKWRSWKKLVDYYVLKNWRMIPIGFRAKSPLKAQYNYESRGARGPYLTTTEAMKWVDDDFNIAIVAGPSNMIWCDIDDPKLFHEEWLQGLVMRTARGYGMPIRNAVVSDADVEWLRAEGYDFRTDILYELAPCSVTCTKDHHLGKVKHPSPRKPCVDGKPHDYRVREWITPLGSPVLRMRDLLANI